MAIWIGAHRKESEKLWDELNLDWAEDDFTVLGVKFNADLRDISEISLRDRIRTITFSRNGKDGN